MRNRHTAFFNRKSYIIAAFIMVVAAFGMTGLYYTQQEKLLLVLFLWQRPLP